MSLRLNTDDSENKSEFAENLNILRQIDFFSKLPIEVMKLFAFLCQRQTYNQGDYIFRQDNDDRCSYYILSGKVKLVLRKEEQNYFIREYESEHYFGLLSLMTPMVKQFSLVAVKDTTCMVMTRDSFSKIAEQFPDISLKIMQPITQNICKAERKCINEFKSGHQPEIKSLLGISLI